MHSEKIKCAGGGGGKIHLLVTNAAAERLKTKYNHALSNCRFCCMPTTPGMYSGGPGLLVGGIFGAYTATSRKFCMSKRKKNGCR